VVLGGNNNIAHRRYTQNIKVTNIYKNPIENATVKLVDNLGTTIFSVTTDSNGNIASQVVLYTTYRSANLGPLIEYTHTITITADGYQTYKHPITLDKAKSLEIKLEKEVEFFDLYGLDLFNIDPTDPQNDRLSF
jgi:hypothetical protein